MTAIDTNAWIAFLHQDGTAAAETVGRLLEHGQCALLPMVLAEVLSDPLAKTVAPFLLVMPLFPCQEGFWARAGELRATLRGHGLKPKLIDTLIAQMCIDYDLTLLTADRDFAAFQLHAGLRLA